MIYLIYKSNDINNPLAEAGVEPTCFFFQITLTISYIGSYIITSLCRKKHLSNFIRQLIATCLISILMACPYIINTTPLQPSQQGFG